MLSYCGARGDSWESLELKEINPLNPKGNQSWIFIGRIDAEAKAPILWPPDVKSQPIGKDPDARKHWKQEGKGVTEDEMVGWHHWLNGSEFEQAWGDGEGQGSLGCCSSWGPRVEHDLVTKQQQHGVACPPRALLLIYSVIFPPSPIRVLAPQHTLVIPCTVGCGQVPQMGGATCAVVIYLERGPFFDSRSAFFDSSSQESLISLTTWSIYPGSNMYLYIECHSHLCSLTFQRIRL